MKFGEQLKETIEYFEKNYLDLDLFKKHNIEIVFQDEDKMERIPLLKKLHSIL